MDRTRTEHKGGIIGRFTGIKGLPQIRVMSTWQRSNTAAATLAILSSSTTPGDSAAGTSSVSGEVYDTDTESEESGSGMVVNLLGRLKSATAADIARPRKTKRNSFIMSSHILTL